MIYLASPYSDPDPAVERRRFDDVCRAAAELMRRGIEIFSPISHSHGIARYGLPKDWGFWQRYDGTFLAWCDELWVLTLPGWDASVGVTAEMKLARRMGKPVRLIDPADLTTENTPAVTGASHQAADTETSGLPGELAPLGFDEPAGVALGLHLSQYCGVEGVGRGTAGAALPEPTLDRQVDQILASHRVAAALGQQMGGRVEEAHPLAAVAAVVRDTLARVTFGGGGVDATANTVVQVPAAAYVERVYDFGDFTGLGI